jgi:hypothetical protein
MKIKEVNISDHSLESDRPIFPESTSQPLNPNYGIREKLLGIKPNYRFSSGLNFIARKSVEKATELSNRVQDFYGKRKKTVILATILIILAIASITSVYISVTNIQQKPSYILNFTANFLPAKILETSNIISISSINSVKEPRSSESPINGILYTKKELDALKENRPIAVMIDNHVMARPQTGVSQADIVYEGVVEGGITRLMAIYWSNKPNTFGPIRSVRNYFIDWLSPFDPLFIQDGCASSTDARIDACGNIVAYKIKNIATFGSWRDTSSGREAPYNEYSSALKALDYAAKNDWTGISDIEPWKFKNDALPDNRGAKTIVRMAFSTDSEAVDYKVEWGYNKANNSYLRKISDDEDIDAYTNKQIEAKVVIIEENNVIPSNDELGHMIIETTGVGSIKILQDGKIVSGTWKKDSRSSRTKYYDKNSKEIELNRGLIWIESLPRNQGQFTIIEQ